jgi:hypothetical protein
MNEGTVMSENHFYATEISSPLGRLFNDMKLEMFAGSAGKDNDQYQINISQSLINEDPFLSFMHPHCKGIMGMLMLPPSNMYNWHVDRRNACNLNYINCTKNKHTFFLAQNAEEHSYFNNPIPIDKIVGYKPLVEMKINPQQWVALNSQNLHAGINFDNEPKFLLQYCIKLTSGLSYFNVLELIKQYEALK